MLNSVLDELSALLHFQARPHDVPLFAWTGTTVRYLADHISATFRQPTPAHCASLSTQQYGRRAFPVAGPTVWNSLPDELRDPAVMSAASNSSLKQSCSALTSVTSALEVIFNVMRSINPRFTCLRTYWYCC